MKANLFHRAFRRVTRPLTLCKAILPLALLAASCTDEAGMGGSVAEGQGKRINLSGEIQQVAVTRVNDSGFCTGDVMGVYVVDYVGNNPGTLAATGNRANNVAHTFDEEAYQWTSAYDIYFRDDYTHVDIYAYYPYASTVENVEQYAFEVQKDQSTDAANGQPGGYEASDFLWGKAGDTAPTSTVIRLPMRHRMSSAKVTLAQGEGFAEGEWTTLAKSVLVKNTKRNALIDLATGTVTATGETAATGTIPYCKDDYYRAIVVPQTIEAGTALFSITVDGTPYSFKKEENFTYVAGKMHNFTIQVNKKSETGTYTFSLLSESVTAWENDAVSHEATMKEYIVINSTAGCLKDSIAAAGKDHTLIQNLKITGEINSTDFTLMRDEMSKLSALNLEQAVIKGDYYTEDDAIPDGALIATSLTKLILPKQLKKIGANSFYGCKNLSGSLIIPEGVTEIGNFAFYYCTALMGTLSLPSTLKRIDNNALAGCAFMSELQLPQNIEYIGYHAFDQCKNLYGELHLPYSLTYIGYSAFSNCPFSGSLIIPPSIKKIESGTFSYCRFDGTLTLHDGIEEIGVGAFSSNFFKGELVLPKNLIVISNTTFASNKFSSITWPEKLVTIGEEAFKGNPLLHGIIKFPESTEYIGSYAFQNCGNLQGIVLPKNITSIGKAAFANCFYMGSIVCEATIPPYVGSYTFDGVPKDNFTLEVPEASVAEYKLASGWNEFKRIAAHHELVCRPSTACAINTEHTATLVLNAEGDWEVESMPDWCSLSQTSGSNKTELTLTIHELTAGSGDRTGEIVFNLTEKDYRHSCTVSQYDYEYAENQMVTEQTATKGSRGGINLVFIGDGFDAADISNGSYMSAMQEQITNFFDIEPYKTYRDYFNVYTGIALSQESGIGTVNTIRYSRFETTYTSGSGLQCNTGEVFNFALQAPTVTEENLCETLIILVPNSTEYGGITNMWGDGSAIAICPLSDMAYPYDTRGVLQHEAGGHGFGKLGDEYIYVNAFITDCPDPTHQHVSEFNNAKALGWYDNLSLTGKMHEVPWSHLIFDDDYSLYVDIYEGGYFHTRGVFRSEQNSCMNNNVPYFSTISREAIVKRIKKYAGEEYTFEEFKANDSMDVGTTVSTRTTGLYSRPQFVGNLRNYQAEPRIYEGKPKIK